MWNCWSARWCKQITSWSYLSVNIFNADKFQSLGRNVSLNVCLRLSSRQLKLKHYSETVKLVKTLDERLYIYTIKACLKWSQLQNNKQQQYSKRKKKKISWCCASFIWLFYCGCFSPSQQLTSITICSDADLNNRQDWKAFCLDTSVFYRNRHQHHHMCKPQPVLTDQE